MIPPTCAGSAVSGAAKPHAQQMENTHDTASVPGFATAAVHLKPSSNRREAQVVG